MLLSACGGAVEVLAVCVEAPSSKCHVCVFIGARVKVAFKAGLDVQNRARFFIYSQFENLKAQLFSETSFFTQTKSHY
ncbi:MAG: hypothetical protein CME71_02925 [Halobacteriovorax sp.]|nr:hypothetical protein [Halobacteriovorax sp.]